MDITNQIEACLRITRVCVCVCVALSLEEFLKENIFVIFFQ